MSWKIAFLGSFHPAVETFRRLCDRHWIRILIVPESAGYKNDELIGLADAYGVPTSYSISDIEGHDPNLVLAANYPKIVPDDVLSRYPCVNTHWSALPKYRGVHPTAWALLNADYEVGVTVHWMTDRFDEGDIIEQAVVHVSPEMDIEDLHLQLAATQAELVMRILDGSDDHETWPRKAQEHGLATYVPKRAPEDGLIHWSWSTERIWNLVRALPAPKYPGAFTYLDGRKLIIWKARPADTPRYFATVGQVVRVLSDDSVWIKTGDTCLEAEIVEFEGGDEPQTAASLLRRGVKLGIDSQWEISNLRARILRLEKEIDLLKRSSRPA